MLIWQELNMRGIVIVPIADAAFLGSGVVINEAGTEAGVVAEDRRFRRLAATAPEGAVVLSREECKTFRGHCDLCKRGFEALCEQL
jgi:hypothetical protein